MFEDFVYVFLAIFSPKTNVQSAYFTMTVEYAHVLVFCSDLFITPRKTKIDVKKKLFFFQCYGRNLL